MSNNIHRPIKDLLEGDVVSVDGIAIFDDCELYFAEDTAEHVFIHHLAEQHRYPSRMLPESTQHQPPLAVGISNAEETL